MKNVNFTVDGDTIKPGMSIMNNDTYDDDGRIQLSFTFSEEWDDTVKVVGFTKGDLEFEPQILRHGKTCEVPLDALNGNFFRMYVIGKGPRKMLKTKDCTVNLVRR